MPEEAQSAEPIFHDPKVSLVDRARQIIRKDYSPYVKDPQTVADNLRSEISPFTPEQQSAMEVTASAINKIIRKKFGKYIPEDVMKRDADIEKRVVVVDNDDLIQYEIAIRYLIDEPERIKTELRPYGSTMGDVVVITKPTDETEQIGWSNMSERMKKSLIKAHGGDEESARTEGNYRFFLSTLYHEIGHVYQPEDLPMTFREAHAYHLASGLYKGYKKDILQSFFDERPLISAYQALLEKRGESVSKMSFGTPVPDSEKRQILEDFKTILKQTLGGSRYSRQL